MWGALVIFADYCAPARIYRTDHRMNLTVLRSFFKGRVTLLILAIVSVAALSVPCHASQKYDVKTNMLRMTSEYARDVIRDTVEMERFRALAAENVPDSTACTKVYLFARGIFRRGDQPLAVDYLKNLSDMLDAGCGDVPDYLVLRLRCQLLLGAAYEELGMFNISMEYAMKGLRMAEESGDEVMAAQFLNNIGVLHIRASELDKAEDYFRRSLELNKRSGSDYALYINYNNLSEIAMRTGDEKTALDMILAAVPHVDVEKSPEDYYYVQSCLGQIYVKGGDYGVAYSCLHNAARNLENLPDKAVLFDTYIGLAELFSGRGEVDSLRIYSSKALDVAEKTGNASLLATYAEKMASFAQKRGDYRRALEMEQRASSLRDSIRQREYSDRIAQVSRIFEMEKARYEHRSFMDDWNPVAVFFIMGSFILVLVGILFWVYVMKRRHDAALREAARADKEIEEIKLRQAQQEKERQEKLLEEERGRKKAMQEELDTNNRRLSTLMLEKVKDGERIESLTQMLRGLQSSLGPRASATHEVLRSALDTLSGMTSGDGMWEEFQYYFERVHPDFYKELDRRHPGLTVKDRRLCALLSLDLSSKDIAAITFREVRSVEASRLRLRKKLGLEGDTSLTDYIRSLG